MTTARPTYVSGHLLAGTMSGATSAVRMGTWVFTPAPADNSSATLQDDCRRVDLRYSAGPLADLNDELGLIEAHFTTLAHTPPASAPLTNTPLAGTPKGCGVHSRDSRPQVAHV